MCLNRENRRALKKKLRDKGSRTLAADVLESLGNEIDKKIRDGDLVILNVDQIIARKDYPRMQGEYTACRQGRGECFQYGAAGTEPRGYIG